MPRLEEVQFYVKGLWMLLAGRPDGFKWLDFSERGFWRSWWAVIYCLPPMALNWAGVRLSYLASMPEGAKAGPDYIARLAMVDLTTWVACDLMLALIMFVSGFASRVTPVIIAVNWLAVPMQWVMIPVSLTQIFSPLNLDIYVSAALPFLLLSLGVHFMVMRRFLDNKSLPTSAFLLAMIVSSLWVSLTLADLLDVVVS